MTAANQARVALGLAVALLISGCGYYKRTDVKGTSSSSASSASVESEPVDLTGMWSLSVSGCEVGKDAWSSVVEIDHDVDDIALRFTYYQQQLTLVGLVTGQKLRADRAVEENDGTLTWMLFEGSYHSGGGIISGDFTDREGVTCTLVLVR